MTAALGAEVSGLDLKVGSSAPFSETIRSDLRAALWAHLVLVFRDQHIDDEAQLNLARCFGEPEVHPIRGALGDPSLLHDIIDTPESIPDRDGWHTDVTYMERPPSVAILRCDQTPEAGGDTLWANMNLAYEKLSPKIKQLLESLQGFHATDAKFNNYLHKHLPAEAIEKIMAAVGTGVLHPIVRTHPESGKKALFVEKSFMERIDGLPDDEAVFVREFLSTRTNDVSIQCRVRWEVGTVVIWDERATQHTGAADHVGSARSLRRCTIAGERPC